MTLVKLKMRAIYKTFLLFIGFLILASLILGTSYLLYDKVVEVDSDIEVNGSLSINYIDGKYIEVEKEKNIKFTITNSGDKVVYYNIGFLKVRGNGTYILKNDNTVVTEGILKSIDEITTDYISIDAGETKVYNLEITNNDTNILKTTLNIRDQEEKIITFADSILSNAHPSESTLTKPGNDIAEEDEGLIKSYDDTGVSYYFRGNVQNNYVNFAGFTWRIVRINGDGTVRLILDGVTDILATYYNDESTNFEFKNSAMEEYLKEWFELNLNDYVDYIANTKFCNDISHDEIYNYNSYARIITNKIPTLNCLGASYIGNIGIISIDEVILAGADTLHSNQKYYLYNETIEDVWYTMSGAKGKDSSINMFMVDKNGNVQTNITGNLYRNVRPVINLIKNLEVTGNGTIDNPYKIAVVEN